MKINIVAGDAATHSTGALLLFVPEAAWSDQTTLRPFNESLQGTLADVFISDYAGKAGETLVLYTRGTIAAARVILVGLGKQDDIYADTLRRAAAVGLQKARALSVSSVAVVLPELGLTVGDAAQAVAEGGMLGLYKYQAMKSTPPSTTAVETLDILAREADIESATTGVQIGQATAEGTILARDLINTPPNICTPEWLAEQAEKMANDNGLSVNILKRKQIEALKMGALLAVAQGSKNAPRFIVLEHRPEGTENQQPIVLVGKGVTFDTGGYSLKTGEGMLGMKMDMSGGAAVIGAMHTIARLNWPVAVIGLIPASDNMVDERSYQPTDVITASNGKTIEIISTDAEGRLLLADALVYAKRYNPAVVVDIATLTGAVVTALGHSAAAVFSTDEALARDLQAAGDTTYERVWPMPLYPEYQKLIDSETADMRNSSTVKIAGSCVGAIFLKNFIDYPAWAHIDMAGKMNAESDTPYTPTGASGFGVRLLTEFVRRRAQK